MLRPSCKNNPDKSIKSSVERRGSGSLDPLQPLFRFSRPLARILEQNSERCDQSHGDYSVKKAVVCAVLCL